MAQDSGEKASLLSVESVQWYRKMFWVKGAGIGGYAVADSISMQSVKKLGLIISAGKKAAFVVFCYIEGHALASFL